jgi:LmbE family N-acetylglucosaminyl deacetylase
MKILVISAHPDDEILGVGGTICKHIANGDEVYVCMVTKAYSPVWSDEYQKTKVEEQKEVDAFLKIKKRYNLDLLTTKLNILPHGELNDMITRVVNDVNPDVVYTHFESDINYDHQLVFRASMVATRPPKKIRLLCYETLSETEWNNKPFNPNLWIDVSGFMYKKCEAFLIYKSEVKENPHPRSVRGIGNLAKKRGNDAHMEYAEAFMVVRDFW